MRAVLRLVPEQWLDERARLGLDVFDEMWEGILHMAPAPGLDHQRLGSKIVGFLDQLLDPRGIQVSYETEVHRPGAGGKDYRIPDVVFFRENQAGLALTGRGLEGAPLALVEILSPDDETYEKFAFYAAIGVPEIIVVNPIARTPEVYRLAGASYLAVSADDRGRVHAASIDVRFSCAPGPRLRLECAGATREI